MSFARISCASPLILFITYIIGNAAVPTWGDALHGGSNEENRDGICSRNRHRGHKATKQPKPLPAPNSDFYEIYETLNAEELATVKRVRAFMEAKVDLNLNLADGTYFLRARLNVSLPGVERDIARAQAKNDPKNANKPEQVIEKIVEGRLNKFYEEVVLLDQPFIKDPAKTVSELVTEKIAKTGERVTIRRFARYKMGEGLEKRADDFGDEVAKLAGA